MAQKIKSIKDLRKLPSGNFRDSKTGVVYAKAVIEKEFAEEWATIKDLEKPVSKSKAGAKVKANSKAKK